MKKRLSALTFALMITVSAVLAGCQTADTTGAGSTTTTTTANPTTEQTLAETEEATDAEDSDETPETITITSLNGSVEEHEIQVPYNPRRIAILDMPSLDILDNLGLGSRIVGIADTSLDYLSEYSDNDALVRLGTIKEPHLENVMLADPDVIFIGGRLSDYYDALSEIAPVVYLEVDHSDGLVNSVRKNATTIASMFGLESEVEAKLDGFNNRVEALAEVANGRDAAIVLVTSGGLNILSDDGRLSMIGNEIGFNNLGNSDNSSTHGNEASFETIVTMNPEFMFVMDRDAAIATEGAAFAKDVIENELIMELDVYKNDQIIYLEHPAVWYTAEGGLTALDVMLGDLEAYLLD